MARTKMTARMATGPRRPGGGGGGKPQLYSGVGGGKQSRGKQLAMRGLLAHRAVVSRARPADETQSALDTYLDKLASLEYTRSMTTNIVKDMQRRIADLRPLQLTLVVKIIYALEENEPDLERFAKFDEYEVRTLWALFDFMVTNEGKLTQKLWLDLMGLQDRETFRWHAEDRQMFQAITGTQNNSDVYYMDQDELWKWFDRKVNGRKRDPKKAEEALTLSRAAAERKRVKQEAANRKAEADPDAMRAMMETLKGEGRKSRDERISPDERSVFRLWNSYAKQHCVAAGDEAVEKIQYFRREFCDGLTSAELLAQVAKDSCMEFLTPEDYAKLQVERVPGDASVKWPFKHLPQRKGARRDGYFNPGDKDTSLGWACLASWYYDRHEGVIERCWKLYDAFKLAHGDRTVDGDEVPFVKRKAYTDLQLVVDDLDLSVAPRRYEEITIGLHTVALFLGNGQIDGSATMSRFQQASLAPLIDRLPSYPERAVEERYLPVDEFVKAIFSTAPATGGPNWNNGIDPTWSKRESLSYEGTSRRELSKAEHEAEQEFSKWLGGRMGEMDYDLRVAAGLCVSEGEEAGPEWKAAKRLLDALWGFLSIHAWPVYRRWKASGEKARFASVQAHHKRWFRDAHYDEYDRWAYFKWAKSWQSSKDTHAYEHALAEMPDLYTLMKRRHKMAMENDECYEEQLAFERADRNEASYAEQRSRYAETYETDDVARPPGYNVHRPSSGGRSYGAGAYTTLKHDPYCTFGRQRGRSHVPTGYRQAKWRTPAEAPLTAWKAVQHEDECNYCTDDPSLRRFPPPPDPPKRPNDEPAPFKPATQNKKKQKLFRATASRNTRRVPQTRFRTRMTEALLGHRRRAAEALAI